MGRNLPNNRTQALSWIQARLNSWVTHATAIGLDTTQVAELAALESAAANARTAAQTARAASKSATLDWHTKADDMIVTASAMVATIKAKALATNNPAIYTLADVSPADPPSPAAPPQQPTAIKARLETEGALELSWKGKGPAGTQYHITRQLPGQAGFVTLGSTSQKRFTDNAPPAGVPQINYRIVAQQKDNQTASVVVQVRFGVGNAGQATATATVQPDVPQAA